MSRAVTKEDGQWGGAENHKRHVEWGVADFVGKYHLNRMTTSTPIPGTAVRVEQERDAFVKQRVHSLKAALEDIETRRSLRVISRTRQAAITARVEVQATVGHRMGAGDDFWITAHYSDYVSYIQRARRPGQKVVFVLIFGGRLSRQITSTMPLSA